MRCEHDKIGLTASTREPTSTRVGASFLIIHHIEAYDVAKRPPRYDQTEVHRPDAKTSIQEDWFASQHHRNFSPTILHSRSKAFQLSPRLGPRVSCPTSRQVDSL